MRLTDRSISALKQKSERYEVWEDGKTGLGLRVSPRGRKTWVFLFRFDGRPRRMSIGVYPSKTLADARMEWGKAKKLLEQGEDPGAQLVDQRRLERQAETVADLITEYLKRHAREHKAASSAAEDERALHREVEPDWGRRKAQSITRRDVITLLDKVADRGSPVMRNRLAALLSRMFGFAVERGILDQTPCIRIRPLPESPRERILSSDEIKSFWTKLDAANMAPVTRLALRFLLVTGQRRGEVAGARRSEIDDESGIWEIPAARTKNRRPHKVPLSSLAKDLLADIDRLRSGEDDTDDIKSQEDREASEWLFPSPLAGRPIAAPALSRALRSNRAKLGLIDPKDTVVTEQSETKALPPVTPHDFRRTCATVMTQLGISRFTVGCVLNHTDRSVTGRVYDKNDYLAKRGEPGRYSMESLTVHPRVREQPGPEGDIK